MRRLSNSNMAWALALLALSAQLAWPLLAGAASTRIAICTGYGLQYVDDPMAPPATGAAHECPCCLLQPAPLAPLPGAPAMRLPQTAGTADPVAWTPATAVAPSYRRPWGRAPPAV